MSTTNYQLPTDMNVKDMLTAYAAENGVTLSFDENGACTLPLDAERVLHLQFRDAIGELDLVAVLGPVPEELRGAVFTRLLAANYYWKETLGATLSWHDGLEQVVLAYPIKTEATDEATLRGTLDRFIDLQDAWVGRLKTEIANAEALWAAEDVDEDLSDLELMEDLLTDSEAPAEAVSAESEMRFDA